ncbi:MAG TPA: hemerythrin domain-containing protein [Kofleriaceae bacterium]|nr:hemerythrin domain-containing protein [Kofleriaceae bacterium]
MNATTLLLQQHTVVRDLFSEYEKAEDGRARRAIFMRIADNLAAHATIEEQIFYPAAYQGDELEDLLEEAVEEHLSMKRIIADLLDMSVTDPSFDAKVTVLREQVEHHVAEEEGELFPKIEHTLDRSELEELGDEMETLFAEIMEDGPRHQVPGETDRAARLH